MNKMAVRLSFVLVSMFLLFQEGESQTTLDITKYGAVADGKTDFSVGLLKAWKEACNATAPTTILIPKGDYALNEVILEGPCTAPIGLTIDGNLKANGDPKKFASGGWINIQRLSKLTLAGKGVLDGDGESAWVKNTCHKDAMCKNLPMNIRLSFVNDSVVRDITSLDSKNFHINLLECNNVLLDHITVTAPGDSANTDGIHMGRSSGINITNTNIKTGDDCISIGDDTSQVLVEGVTCGPGHGISIGSLGKYAKEGPVSGINIRQCTLTGTTNGVRIKTWPSCPAPGTASDMHFENIVMNNVSFPVLIDQEYCPWNQCNLKTPSSIKISNVSFRNITGTSATAMAVKLVCSKSNPCTNVQVSDIDLTYSGPEGPITSLCTNVQPTLSGKLTPQVCSGAPANSSAPGAPANASAPGAPAAPAQAAQDAAPAKAA